jgi:PRD domain protein (TIGR03582 family)
MVGLNQIEIKEIITRSGDEKTCKDILNKIQLLIKERKLHPTHPQWLSLVSHISAMVNRNMNEESIRDLNASLFSEVSSKSIEMAKVICGWLPHLHKDETYLLAIHFETIKNNE